MKISHSKVFCAAILDSIRKIKCQQGSRTNGGKVFSRTATALCPPSGHFGRSRNGNGSVALDLCERDALHTSDNSTSMGISDCEVQPISPPEARHAATGDFPNRVIATGRRNREYSSKMNSAPNIAKRPHARIHGVMDRKQKSANKAAQGIAGPWVVSGVQNATSTGSSVVTDSCRPAIPGL